MATRIFYSYSHRDEALRDELERHLSLLRREGLISEWHDRRIGAGSDWGSDIDANLAMADIVLLLVSSDFLHSDYCYEKETALALERHRCGEAVVIPVILRPCDWKASPFGKFQALPKNGKPVTKWANRDEAFFDIARGIREVVQRRSSADASREGVSAQMFSSRVPDPDPVRVLDAAFPKRVTVGRTAELMAVVRRSTSGGLRALLQIEEEAEVSAEDVRSKPFALEFPLDLSGRPAAVKVSLVVDAPGFQPHAQKEAISVPPYGDSEVCRFLLVAKQAGELKVMLKAVVEDEYQTARVLRTTADTVAAPVASMWVVSMPLYTMSATIRLDAPVHGSPAPPDKFSYDAMAAPTAKPSRQSASATTPEPQTVQPPMPSSSPFRMMALGAFAIAGVTAVFVGSLLIHEVPQPTRQTPQQTGQMAAPPEMRVVVHPFKVVGPDVSVGCAEQTQSKVQFALPSGAFEVQHTCKWGNTVGVKANPCSTTVDGSTALAVGSLVGRDREFLNCPGGGHGQLELSGSYKLKEAVQTQ